LGGLGIADELGEGGGGAVGRHLVVLDALGAADQNGVLEVLIASLAGGLVAFTDDGRHGLALVAPGGLAEALEDLLEALGVAFGWSWCVWRRACSDPLELERKMCLSEGRRKLVPER